MSNYPDDIRDFDDNPQSPFYESDEDYIANEVDKLFKDVDFLLEKIFEHPDFNNKFSDEHQLLHDMWHNKSGETEDAIVKQAEQMVRDNNGI